MEVDMKILERETAERRAEEQKALARTMDNLETLYADRDEDLGKSMHGLTGVGRGIIRHVEADG